MTTPKALWLSFISFGMVSAFLAAMLRAQDENSNPPSSADNAAAGGLIATLTAAIQANPNDALLYRKRGYAYLSDNQFDAALADLNRAIALNPKDPNSYRLIGFCYFRKGDYENAVDSYSKTIELNPNSAIAYARRGQSEALENDRDDAVEDLNKAMALSPTGAQRRITSSVIAATWRVLGDPQKAQEALDKPAQADAQDPTAPTSF